MLSAPLAFLAGGCALVGLRELLGAPAALVADRGVHTVAGLADVVGRLGREGRDPGAVERRRLLLAGAVLAGTFGALALGPLAGLGLACGGPFVVARLLRARRVRYRRAIDAGVG
ncbi:MAG TPA: hypothetical protein VI111_02350, partial [Thermoleophilaceae bacterium]